MDSRHLADAFLLVAKANHYLVSVDTSRASFDDLSDAQQILIRMEGTERDGKTLQLAIDLSEAAINNFRGLVSHHG
jgi:hypothetical protein